MCRYLLPLSNWCQQGVPLKRQVLIVDDDASLRTGLAMLVGGEGHEVLVAATVNEGMAKLASSEPSHLLLDMNLPDGLGTTILRHVRSKNLPVRVAVLSGTADATLLAEAVDEQPDAMFTKPPDWDALLDWVAAE